MNRSVAAGTIVVCLGTAFTACHRSPDLQHLHVMERLTQRTDSLKGLVQQVDTAALHHMEALFNGDRSAIEARFADTLAPSEAEVLGNYHRLMSLALPRVLNDHRVLRSTLDSTSTRLWQLHHDVEHTLFTPEQEQDHVKQEQARCAVLERSTIDLVARVAVIERDHVHYRPDAERLLHRSPPDQ